jgi:rhomboid family GlyGly-CTERM serine protease
MTKLKRGVALVNGRAALAIAALFAVVAALVPGAADWLVFDRVPIEDGQTWRLLTGHWVHFSAIHLCWNLIALFAASMLMQGAMRRVWPVLLASAIGIGLSVFWFELELRQFGGLSGVTTALITCGAVGRARSEPAFRPLALLGLVLLSAKLIWEITTQSSLFASLPEQTVRTSWIAHFAGILIGTAFGLATGTGDVPAIAARIPPCSPV